MQDSSLLRSTDRILGSIACGMISAVRRLRPEFPAPVVLDANSKPKILLIELFEMGAAVMLIPSIRKLKADFPGAQIHCLTTRSCAAVWKSIEEISPEHLHFIDSGSAARFLLSTFQQVLRLRKIQFDVIIDYELFMRIPAMISGFLKGRLRAGFYKYDLEGLYRGNFYQRICPFNQNTHISKNFMALTQVSLLEKNAHPNLKSEITADQVRVQPITKKIDVALLKRVLKVTDLETAPYFVVCPDVGSTLSMRNYPLPQLVTVIGKLLAAHPSHRVVLIGTEDNRSVSEEVMNLLKSTDRCIDACGSTTFSEVVELIRGADALITNDNGPAHFATLTGTKTVALFSTDSPFMYGPLGKCVILYSFYHCSPCISAFNHKRSTCDDNRCLQVITADRVFQAVQSVIAGTAKFQTVNGQVPYLFH